MLRDNRGDGRIVMQVQRLDVVHHEAQSPYALSTHNISVDRSLTDVNVEVLWLKLQRSTTINFRSSLFNDNVIVGAACHGDYWLV